MLAMISARTHQFPYIMTARQIISGPTQGGLRRFFQLCWASRNAIGVPKRHH